MAPVMGIYGLLDLYVLTFKVCSLGGSWVVIATGSLLGILYTFCGMEFLTFIQKVVPSHLNSNHQPNNGGVVGTAQTEPFFLPWVMWAKAMRLYIRR